MIFLIKLMWRILLNAGVLWLIGTFLIPAFPTDLLTLAEIAAILAVVNHFL